MYCTSRLWIIAAPHLSRNRTSLITCSPKSRCSRGVSGRRNPPSRRPAESRSPTRRDQDWGSASATRRPPSMDLTCHSQNPATSSLVSVNGPSRPSVHCPECTRLPRTLLGCSPSAASMTPALTSSSLNRPSRRDRFAGQDARFAVCGRFDHDHDFHRYSPPRRRCLGGISTKRRGPFRHPVDVSKSMGGSS